MRVNETSAMPVGLRSRVPAKMTSSIRAPRKVFADCSPSTHEIASEMLDLPHPLGPMIAATPSPWNLSSVRSQNDLNPRICSLFSLSNVNSFDPVTVDQRPVASRSAQVGDDRIGVYQEDSPPGLDAFRGPRRTRSARHIRPRLDRAGTKLSYCTDEIQAASRNITLYVV